MQARHRAERGAPKEALEREEEEKKWLKNTPTRTMKRRVAHSHKALLNPQTKFVIAFEFVRAFMPPRTHYSGRCNRSETRGVASDMEGNGRRSDGVGSCAEVWFGKNG